MAEAGNEGERDGVERVCSGKVCFLIHPVRQQEALEDFQRGTHSIRCALEPVRFIHKVKKPLDGRAGDQARWEALPDGVLSSGRGRWGCRGVSQNLLRLPEKKQPATPFSGPIFLILLDALRAFFL